MKHRIRNGFSLLEAIISMAIAGLIMTAFFQTTSTNLKLTRASTEKAHAALLIQSLMTQIGSQIPLVRGIHRGNSSYGYSWRIEIEPTRLGALGINAQDTQRLYRVNIDIFQNRTEKRIEHIETYRVGIN